MIRQLPRIPSDAVIPSPRPQKKNRKTSRSFSPVPSAGGDSLSSVHERKTHPFWHRMSSQNYRVAATLGQIAFYSCSFDVLLNNSRTNKDMVDQSGRAGGEKKGDRCSQFSIPAFSNFVIAQEAVLCVMFFCDTRPSQKAIQLFPPPVATIVSVRSKRRAFLWSRSVDGFIHSRTQYGQCENMLPRKLSWPL